ncbi:uncharacterized protein YALI1_E06676g [Yarrowia lipolytica]|uniref:Uncharacterized protein n=1 Tax=Yarrowia lipolytica TaxID=4952 RepID=A0A1D8NH97_YARLL|nr:hypothetical protein YALI1_E06676g [Yarrowia lipolytica]
MIYDIFNCIQTFHCCECDRPESISWRAHPHPTNQSPSTLYNRDPVGNSHDATLAEALSVVMKCLSCKPSFHLQRLVHS